MKNYAIYYLFSFIFFCSICTNVGAQENVQIDSLNKMLKSSKPDSIKANCMNKLSEIFRAVGNLDSANYYSFKSLKISKRINYKQGVATSLYYLSIVNYIRGNYINAIDTMTIAAEMFKTAGNLKDYSSLLSVIGGIENAMGNLSSALDYQLQSLKIKEIIGDSANLPTAFNNIGNVYASSFEFEKALSYFQRALKLNIKFKKFNVIPDNYFSIANMYSTMKCDSLALVNVNISIHLSDSLGQIESLSYSYGLVASILLEKNDFKGASEYCMKSLAISEKFDDKRMIAVNCKRLGIIYQKNGEKKKAESFMLKALQIAEEINFLENVIECQYSLSQLYEENGDYQKALLHYKECKDAEAKLFNEEKGKEMTRKEMNYEFDKKQALNKLEQNKKDAVAREKENKQKIIIYSISFGLLLVLFILFVIYRSYRQKQKANYIITQQKNEVENQKNIIEEKHKEITDSINYAERIQRSFLATTELLDENLNEYFVFFLPKDIVSGDFYWANKLNNGNFVLVTADSTGHGVPGAIMSILNISSLEKAIDQGLINPSEILNKTRKTIIERLKKDGSQEGGKDGMDASLICFDGLNQKLTYSAANNPIWIVRNKKVIELSPDKMPVGKHNNDDVPFTHHGFDLQKNDMVYTFTDGLPDQFGGPKGKKFMYKQLKELLINISEFSMLKQKDILTSSLNNWKGDLDQVDDICLIGIRI